MEKITKEQYEQAKVIVDKYNTQLKEEFNINLSHIKTELVEYFKNNDVCGCKIVKFEVRERNSWCGPITFKTAEIVPIDPYFDEDYEDDKADNDIEAIGQKYGIDLGWASGVYSK